MRKTAIAINAKLRTGRAVYHKLGGRAKYDAKSGRIWVSCDRGTALVPPTDFIDQMGRPVVANVH